jgi:hypothetical protein
MRNIFSKILLGLCLFLTISGCSSVRFTSNGKLPVKFEADENHQKEVVIHLDKKFYLWGLIPDEHIVYVDEMVDEAGFEVASGVSVKEVREGKNMLLTLLSFGLYVPRSYTVQIFTTDE